MAKFNKIPAISGNKLIRLLSKDSWEIKRKTTHGVALAKKFDDYTRVTIIPATSASLDTGTLAAILGPKQTNIGKKGLLELINKSGI